MAITWQLPANGRILLTPSLWSSPCWLDKEGGDTRTFIFCFTSRAGGGETWVTDQTLYNSDYCWNTERFNIYLFITIEKYILLHLNASFLNTTKTKFSSHFSPLLYFFLVWVTKVSIVLSTWLALVLVRLHRPVILTHAVLKVIKTGSILSLVLQLWWFYWHFPR